MYRPCIHIKTGIIETLEIENCQNIEDYIVVWISREANQNSLSLNWQPIDQEVPTRAKALAQEAQYEDSLIEEAVNESKRRKGTKIITE